MDGGQIDGGWIDGGQMEGGRMEGGRIDGGQMEGGQIGEVLPGIYRISVPLAGNPLRELNSYVIRGQRNLLVDTGFRTGACRKAVLEGLDCLGIHMDNTDILLTHLHADHSGNAADLISRGGKVYISGIDRACLTGSVVEDGTSLLHRLKTKRLEENGISPELIQAMLRETPSRTMAADEHFTGYTSLEEGDVISVGDYRLRAVYTPGHTPGHMCFEIQGTGAMILGDHVLFDITPNITDWPGVEDSLGDYLNSLDKIAGCNVTLPLPGHRKTGDFRQRVKDLKAHHEQRLAECLEVVRRLGHARLYDITGGMSWKIRSADWDHFPPAQRWFALGECLAHLDHLERMGEVVRCGTGWCER